MKTKYIIGIGEVLWDILPEGRKVGGAPANFAYHIAQFGLPSYVVSAIGEDALGDELLFNFEERQLAGIIPRVAYPTGSVIVGLDKDGVPQYDICQNVAWDNIPFTAEMEALARSTKVVCFGSLAQRDAVSRETISSFIKAMPDGEGQYKIFDVNLRQNFYIKELLHESMEQCNILKINNDELSIIAEMFDCQSDLVEQSLQELLQRYKLDIIILTCGITCSYIFTANSCSFMATPKVDVCDTVGAGDSFTAAFIAALLHGVTLEQAHRLAVNVSAYVCTQHGAMPLIPSAIQKSTYSDILDNMMC